MNFRTRREQLVSLEELLHRLHYQMWVLTKKAQYDSKHAPNVTAMPSRKRFQRRQTTVGPEYAEQFRLENFRNLCTSFHRIVYELDVAVNEYYAFEFEISDHYRKGVVVDFPRVAPSYCDAICILAREMSHPQPFDVTVAMKYRDELLKRERANQKRIVEECNKKGEEAAQQLRELFASMEYDDLLEILESIVLERFNSLEKQVEWTAEYIKWCESFVQEPVLKISF